MNHFWLRITLDNDATFGRGDGVAGLVDVETQHDENGLPFLGGRAIKGVLVEECADILNALPVAKREVWRQAARDLFGQPGSKGDDQALLFIGNARLPEDVRRAVAEDVRNETVSRADVLETFTALRKQTAMDEAGVPREHTLRTMRVILRQTVLESDLYLPDFERTDRALALLAACIKAFRRAGTGRTRGRGKLTADLLDNSGQSLLQTHFDRFRNEVLV